MKIKHSQINLNQLGSSLRTMCECVCVCACAFMESNNLSFIWEIIHPCTHARTPLPHRQVHAGRCTFRNDCAVGIHRSARPCHTRVLYTPPPSLSLSLALHHFFSLAKSPSGFGCPRHSPLSRFSALSILLALPPPLHRDYLQECTYIHMLSLRNFLQNYRIIYIRYVTIIDIPSR